MKWLWGAKREEQESTPLAFETKSRRRDVVRQIVRVHLDLDIEYPPTTNVVQALRETKANFELPPGVDMKAAHISRVEILRDKTS